jgi:hypothetical protein
VSTGQQLPVTTNYMEKMCSGMDARAKDLEADLVETLEIIRASVIDFWYEIIRFETLRLELFSNLTIKK